MMKSVVGFEKWCLCNGYYSCPVVAEFVYASNFEEEIEEFRKYNIVRTCVVLMFTIFK